MRLLFRLVVGGIFSVFAGCLPTAGAAPDVSEMPDDGTAIVERESVTGDAGETVDEATEETTDGDTVTFPDEVADEVAGEETPDDDRDVSPLEALFDAAIRPAVLAELARAQKEVTFATFTFSDGEVLGRLNTLAGRGVTVRGVVGSPIEAGDPLFPVRVYSNEENGIMHEKFFLVDGETVLLSSGNIAYQNIRNNLLIIRGDPLLAHALADEFAQLEQGIRGVAKTAICPPVTGCAVRDGNLFFSPGACAGVSSLIAGIPAGMTAYLLMYGVTDNAPMYGVLKDLPGRGVTLRVLLDDWVGDNGSVANQPVFDDLVAAGATVSYYDGEMVFHHKVFMTPSTVLTGSMNWTYAGCMLNDEVVFLSHETTLLEPFGAYAEEVFP